MTNPPDLVFIWFDGYFILIFLQKSGYRMNAEKKQDFPRRKIVFLKVHNENFFQLHFKNKHLPKIFSQQTYKKACKMRIIR